MIRETNLYRGKFKKYTTTLDSVSFQSKILIRQGPSLLCDVAYRAVEKLQLKAMPSDHFNMI